MDNKTPTILPPWRFRDSPYYDTGIHYYLEWIDLATTTSSDDMPKIPCDTQGKECDERFYGMQLIDPAAFQQDERIYWEELPGDDSGSRGE